MAASLNFFVNLEMFAKIQIAASCWECPEIKNEIKRHFLSFKPEPVYDYPEEHSDSYGTPSLGAVYYDCNYRPKPRRVGMSWNIHKYSQKKLVSKWSSQIIDKFCRDVSLPDSQKKSISYTIVYVGRRLVAWLSGLVEKLRYGDCDKKNSQLRLIFEHYLDNIFWTNYGTIDEVKVFESLCSNEKITDVRYLWGEACYYCLEEYIDRLWEKKGTSQYETCARGFSPDVTAYWSRKKFLQAQNTSEESNPWAKDNAAYWEKYANNFGTENLKLLSAAAMLPAVRYFSSQMSSDTKDNHLYNAVETLFWYLEEKRKRLKEINDDDRGVVPDNLFEDKHADTLVFLMLQMSVPMRYLLLKNSCEDIAIMLIEHWPWRYLLGPLLNTKFYRRCLETKRVIKSIMGVVIDQYKMGITEKPSGRMLFTAWNLMSPNFKKRSGMFFYNFMNKTGDVKFAKLVVNDPALSSQREELVHNLLDYCHDLIYYSYHEVPGGNYNMVERILKEIICTDDANSDFKSKIDSLRICTSLVSCERYVAADKYLNWRFDTEEERNNFKKILKLSDSFGSIVTNILINYTGYESQASCVKKFIDWFMYEENDTENLKRQLEGESSFQVLCRDAAEKREWKEVLLEFVKYCSFSQAEVDELATKADTC